jgi:sialate O-acetylesterase
MQWPVSRSNDPERVAAGADHPRMRLMTIREASVDRPRRDIEGQWDICTPESVREFSAVGYHFGSGLLQELDVPIGLIDNALGGTRAEAWTSMAALEAEPALDPLLEKWQAYDAAWDADTELALYERRRAAWLPIYYEMRAAGQRPPRGPRLDSRRPDSRDHPANLYRGVVAPLTELPIRGVIWYQGEYNANRAVQYRTLFPAMIRDWRQQWDDPDLPFIFVQIAGWGPVAEQPEEHMRAELREAQTAALDLPNTAMVTAVDVGDFDVHPIDKQTVGERLTQAALKLVYGKQVVANGPTFDAMQITGDTAQIQFDHLGGGLVAKDGQPLTGFAIAGEDRQFVWADAEIDGDIVVVQSDQVSEPVAVRYGWAGHPQMSLYNSEGFPALPFRTDDWPLTTQDRHGPWD